LIKNSQPFGKNFQKTVGGDFYSDCRLYCVLVDIFQLGLENIIIAVMMSLDRHLTNGLLTYLFRTCGPEPMAITSLPKRRLKLSFMYVALLLAWLRCFWS